MNKLQNQIRLDLKNNTIESVLETYDLSFNELFKLLNNKLTKTPKTFEMRYLYRRGRKYVIQKEINNKSIYFGEYSLDVAKKIRDELEEKGWDKNQLPSIKEKWNNL